MRQQLKCQSIFFSIYISILNGNLASSCLFTFSGQTQSLERWPDWPDQSCRNERAITEFFSSLNVFSAVHMLRDKTAWTTHSEGFHTRDNSPASLAGRWPPRCLLSWKPLHVFGCPWCLSPQPTVQQTQKKLEINTSSRQQTKSRVVPLWWWWFEIHLQCWSGRLKMHRIMGIKGAPICPA